MKPEISIDDGLVENVLKELEDELVEKVLERHSSLLIVTELAK